MHNQRTGETYKANTLDEVHQYAAHISGQGARVPLGNFVNRITKSLGMKRCTSCAKRQVRMNRLFR